MRKNNTTVELLALKDKAIWLLIAIALALFLTLVGALGEVAIDLTSKALAVASIFIGVRAFNIKS